jgi:alpha,alpha-trehalase
MRESGFDPSFRFGPFDGATHHYAPVCLNSLLYRYERDLSISRLLGKPAGRAALGAPRQGAQRRHAALSLAAKEGVFADFDFVTPNPRVMPTSLRSILCGPAWPRANRQSRWSTQLNLFERPGGLSMSKLQLRHAMG